MLPLRGVFLCLLAPKALEGQRRVYPKLRKRPHTMKMVNPAPFGRTHQLDLFSLKFCCRCPSFAMPKGNYCRPCHAAYMREWRKTHPLTEEQRIKDRARSYANVYQKRGKLTPQGCSVKGCNHPAEKHHHDYSKPLDVEWMCRKHHLQSHGYLLYLPA